MYKKNFQRLMFILFLNIFITSAFSQRGLDKKDYGTLQPLMSKSPVKFKVIKCYFPYADGIGFHIVISPKTKSDKIVKLAKHFKEFYKNLNFIFVEIWDSKLAYQKARKEWKYLERASDKVYYSVYKHHRAIYTKNNNTGYHALQIFNDKGDFKEIKF